MRTAGTYGQYIEHDNIPGKRAYVLCGKGASVILRGDDFRRQYRNKQDAKRKIANEFPGALGYVFNEGVTVCAGLVDNW